MDTTETFSEFRIRRVHPEASCDNITWMGPSRVRVHLDRVAGEDNANPNLEGEFVVQQRRVTVARSEWVDA